MVMPRQLSPDAAELWAAVEACDGSDLRPVLAATVEYLRRTRGPWRRRPAAQQCCDHHEALRSLDRWPESGVWICRCCCVRCGHMWTEAGVREPAHVMVGRELRRQLIGGS